MQGDKRDKVLPYQVKNTVRRTLLVLLAFLLALPLAGAAYELADARLNVA